MTKANKQALAAAGCALALLPLLAGALVPRDIPAPPARQGSAAPMRIAAVQEVSEALPDTEESPLEEAGEIQEKEPPEAGPPQAVRPASRRKGRCLLWTFWTARRLSPTVWGPSES